MASDGSAAPRPRKQRGAPKRSTTYGALDLGTNNCRLLIAERAGQGFRVVDSYSRIVRLGEGLNATGQLSDNAMARAHEALKVCSDKLKKHKVEKVRCITTQACRAAKNGASFVSEVKDATGLKLETISPKEEAKLALLGSLDLIDSDKDFALVVDIGGGSTELCWVDAKAARTRGVAGSLKRPPILGWASFPIGVVTLSEAHPEHGDDWYEQLVEHVVGVLSEHDGAQRFGKLFADGRGHLLGTSGTVTSLTAVHLGLSRYIRSEVDGAWMSQAGMDEARDQLRFVSTEERAKLPCIGPERADLVLAGCAILDAVWRLWPAERLRAADRGLREGVLLGLMHGAAKPKKRRRGRGGGSQRKKDQSDRNDG